MRKGRPEEKEFEFSWIYWVCVCSCIALYSQCESIWFCLQLCQHFAAAAGQKSERHFPPTSRSTHSPAHLTSAPPRPDTRFAASRCSSLLPGTTSTTKAAAAAAAAAASLYQHTSARQMIHPLRVLQTNTLPPSRCLSAV